MMSIDGFAARPLANARAQSSSVTVKSRQTPWPGDRGTTDAAEEDDGTPCGTSPRSHASSSDAAATPPAGDVVPWYDDATSGDRPACDG